jgi:hypothetical protein
MPKAAPKAVLDIWSQPAGADISLDGGYVGKTPYSLTVAPGEHTIALHKQDFGSWQRRMQVDGGTHQVGAYLEQKTLALDFWACSARNTCAQDIRNCARGVSIRGGIGVLVESDGR